MNGTPLKIYIVIRKYILDYKLRNTDTCMLQFLCVDMNLNSALLYMYIYVCIIVSCVKGCITYEVIFCPEYKACMQLFLSVVKL